MEYNSRRCLEALDLNSYGAKEFSQRKSIKLSVYFNIVKTDGY